MSLLSTKWNRKKFFDIKYVFSDVDNANESKKSLDIFKNDMNQR